MKRFFVSLAATAILVGMMGTTAFAHGGHGHGGNQTTQQNGSALCKVYDCEIPHSHRHDGHRYSGQAGLTGDYAVCKVEDCAAIGLHEHDGAYYHCRSYNSGSGRSGGRGHHRIDSKT